LPKSSAFNLPEDNPKLLDIPLKQGKAGEREEGRRKTRHVDPKTAIPVPAFTRKSAPRTEKQEFRTLLLPGPIRL
jgi:hypothetical protein